MIPTRPNIVVLCMKKAASTFVADVLLPSIALRTADYDLWNVGSQLILHRERCKAETGALPPWADDVVERQLPFHFREYPLPRSNHLLGRVYPHYLAPIEAFYGENLPSPNHRLAVVRRDPRDALVSLYYSMAVSHSTQVPTSEAFFHENRARLLQRTVCEGIKVILSDPRTNYTCPQFLFCTDLLRQHRDVCDLSYEMLINEPRAWLTRFVEFGQLQSYVDEAWYDEMLGHLQPPAVEDPQRHKRRMRPGNWRDVFDDELRDMVDQLAGDRMRQFGYHWDDPPSTTKQTAA